MISAFALIVSGCGGGGGGGGGSSTGGSISDFGSAPTDQKFFDYLNVPARPAAQRNALRDVVVTLATGSTPIRATSSGTVHLSRSTGGLVTEVLDAPSGNVKLTIGADELESGADGITSITNRVRGQRIYTSHHLSKDGDAVAEVLVYSSREGSETDFYTFGHWLVDDDNVWDTVNTQMGMFAHNSGTPTPASYLFNTGKTEETVLTYSGDARGYATHSPSGQGQQHTLFAGTVELTARLRSSNPVIGGKISDVEYEDVTLHQNLNEITLADASIENTAGGFFADGVTSNPVLPDNGRWGGRFGGDTAEIFSGTFFVGGSLGSFRMAGSFGAEKQTPTE